jgi:hypothetical protein
MDNNRAISLALIKYYYDLDNDPNNVKKLYELYLTLKPRFGIQWQFQQFLLWWNKQYSREKGSSEKQTKLIAKIHKSLLEPDPDSETKQYITIETINENQKTVDDMLAEIIGNKNYFKESNQEEKEKWNKNIIHTREIQFVKNKNKNKTIEPERNQKMVNYTGELYNDIKNIIPKIKNERPLPKKKTLPKNFKNRQYGFNSNLIDDVIKNPLQSQYSSPQNSNTNQLPISPKRTLNRKPSIKKTLKRNKYRKYRPH